MNKKEENNDNEIIPEKSVDISSDEDISQDLSELDDSVVAEENLNDAVKKLREKIKKIEAEKMEYLTGWQRSKADLINARKRDEEERKEFMKFANQNLIEDLLPVLESFDMAMSNKEVWEKADKNWRTGVEYIYSQFYKTLSENGLKESNPLGEKFDHNRHEASSYEPVSEKEKDHMIIRVIQKGYSLNEKELRVPKVVVGEFKE